MGTQAIALDLDKQVYFLLNLMQNQSNRFSITETEMAKVVLDWTK